MNITLSVMVQENMLFGENIDYKNLIKEKEYKHTGIEYKEVGMYLAGEENIQNKIIMANERDFAHYAKSKFVWTTFNEGEQDDTINEFLNRENWSKYEIIESNMASQPPDRRDKHNHTPDYIIIQKDIDMKKLDFLINKFVSQLGSISGTDDKSNSVYSGYGGFKI